MTSHDVRGGGGQRTIGGGEDMDGGPVPLTAREQEIWALLQQAKTAHEICDALCIALPTVRAHIKHIRRKLGVGHWGWATRAGPPKTHDHPGANPEKSSI